MNIYLTDTDEEAVVDFVKYHEDLYDKTDEYIKDEVKKECLPVCETARLGSNPKGIATDI